MEKYLLILFLLITSIACQSSMTDEVTPFREIPSPVEVGGEPNLFVTKEGQAYLSWVGYVNDTTDALRFSKLENLQWSPASQIVQGADWFVNWADFPSLVAFHGNPKHLAAHWLQKSADGVYDYDVRIAQSKDGGTSWSPSFIPHRDGIPAEHGFVTMIPLENGNMFAVWLDGRNTKDTTRQDGTHGHGGAMTLRTAEFDTEGQLSEEAELDGRVCDCCQTDAALTTTGPIVVYRNRSESEIRDIAIVRKVDGQWTAPQIIHDDNWEIKGCPVNGPAIAAQDNFVALAWFTAANKTNQVNVMLSTDAGKTFSDPIRLDDGQAMGRVDVVLANAETAIVSWLEEVGEGGEIRLARVNTTGKIGPSISVTKAGVSRQSGFPILEKLQNDYLLAWTSVDSVSTVKTMLLSL